MNGIAVALAMPLILAACASASSGLAPTGAAGAAAGKISPGAAEKDVNVADVLDVEDYEDDLVCRREAPLGSRIAHLECYARDGSDDTRDAWEDYLTQQELRELRDQQMYREQARRAAFEAAMRAIPSGGSSR